MRRSLLAVLPLAVMALLSGCGHITGGTSPSTEPLEPGSYREMGSVRGQDCVGYLLGFIPLSDGNETKMAVADALKRAPGATALIKVTADTYSQHFIVYARVCTQVDGVAVAPK